MATNDGYYFNESACQRIATYLKIYCKNNECVNGQFDRIGGFSVGDRKYRLFERGQFGWWVKDNTDRCVFVTCIDTDEFCYEDDVMLYNCVEGKWIVEKDCSDVYMMWVDNMEGWLQNEGTYEEMKEAGYDKLAVYNPPMKKIESSEEESSEEESSEEVDGERVNLWVNIVDTVNENPIFQSFAIAVTIYIVLILFIGLFLGNDSCRSEEHVLPVVRPIYDYESDYYCENGVCHYYFEDLD